MSPKRWRTAARSISIRCRRPRARRRRHSSTRSTWCLTAPFPGDLRFFKSLDRFVQHEPWIDRDRAMIDMLKTIGIEKGKTFAPDQGMQAVLKDAIGEARAWLDNRYEGVFTTSFNEGSSGCSPRCPVSAKE